MKIVALSDLHNHYPEVMPAGDVLLIAGDITFAECHDFELQKHHFENFVRWCQYLFEQKLYRDIVFIAGNHDGIFEYMALRNEEEDFRKGLPSYIHYLRDSLVDIGGVKIWGIPWSLPYCSWWFNAPEIHIADACTRIPEGVDIVISHGPAYGLSDDINERGGLKKTGSQALLQHIKRAKPVYLIVGHVHNGSHTPIKLQCGDNIITSVNVSLLNADYNIAFPPFEFEVKNEKTKNNKSAK